jgi:hypothetical protein
MSLTGGGARQKRWRRPPERGLSVPKEPALFRDLEGGPEYFAPPIMSAKISDSRMARSRLGFEWRNMLEVPPASNGRCDASTNEWGHEINRHPPDDSLGEVKPITSARSSGHFIPHAGASQRHRARSYRRAALLFARRSTAGGRFNGRAACPRLSNLRPRCALRGVYACLLI